MGTSSGFLSVLRWPARSPSRPDQPFAEEDGVEILAEAVGLAPADARQAIRRGTPQVTCMLDREVAPTVLASLRKFGVAATFMGRESLETAPLRAKRLRPALGAPEPMYAVEPWRGEGEVLHASRISLMVRATLRTVESRSERGPAYHSGGVTAGYMIGGVGGAAVAASLDGGDSLPNRSTRMRTTDMLDIHLADGGSVRIDGDKFSFDVLGDAKGLTDRENMDRLAARLRSEAPHALFDTNFAQFSCPPQYLNERTWGGANLTGKRTSQDRAFDFYSAWLAGIRLAVTGVQKSR